MAKRIPTIRLDGGTIQKKHLRAIATGNANLALSSEAKRAVRRAQKVVDDLLDQEEVAYGINTGFGRFCRVRISPQKVKELQRNLIRSHGAGVGEPLSPEVVRLTMAFRANALARGNSGLRLETLELLLDIYNAGIVPWIPSQGSVGACGDLAPLAHLAQVLIGEGQAYVGGKLVRGRTALSKCGLEPVVLHAKEGLSLINGVQASCALLADALLRADTVLEAADVCAALTLDSLYGSFAPFDARIHDVRPHPGQAKVASRVLDLLQGSQINLDHADCDKVQDAYSLRCVPQVHGAVRDRVDHVWETLMTEIASSTDNPLIFPEQGDVLSGGNFHGAPIAYVADLLGIVLADLASISERRIERLVNPDLSDLPPFLVREDGIESGYMMAQVTAAALVSENKVLSHPASVDSVPTSANTEDHVSMSTHAARKSREIVRNVERVLAIELLIGSTALERRRPLKSGRKLEKVVRRFLDVVAPNSGDRNLTGEIEATAAAIREGVLGS